MAPTLEARTVDEGAPESSVQEPLPAEPVQLQERPEILEGFTAKMKLGYGTLYITINELDNKPVEVFATIGKSGQSMMAKTEAIGRLVSLALSHGIPVEKIVDQLNGIGGEHPVFQKDGLVRSIPDAVARILKRRYMKQSVDHGNNEKSREEVMNEVPDVNLTVSSVSMFGNKCPECGATDSLVPGSGCVTCSACFWEKCG